MKKRIYSLLVLSMMAFGMVSAQNQPTEQVEYTFNPHWFIQLQGGVQETLGEASFTDLISPTVQGAIGYQFSPVWGLRLGVNAWQSKAGWGEGVTRSFGLADNTFKWNYVAPAIDVKFNIINAIWGWKPERWFNVNLIAGGGLNFAQKTDDGAAIYAKDANLLKHYRTSSEIMPFGHFGLDFDFALSQRVSLNIEGTAAVLNDHYNGKHTDNADWYFNVLGGIKIALGKTVNKKVTVIEPEPVVVVEPEPAPEPAPVVEEKVEPFQCNVFFKINKTVAEAQEVAKVKELAAYMAKYPESKVTLSGYADKGTGNPRINSRLSEGRVNYVANMLRNEYNIDADRIYTEFKGDTVQPFADNDSNRVTICVTK